MSNNMAGSFKVSGVFGGPSAIPVQLNSEVDGDAFKFVLGGGCVISAPIAGGLFTLNPARILGRAGSWVDILTGDWLQKDGKYIDAERRYAAAQSAGDPNAAKVALSRIAKMYEKWGTELRLKGDSSDAIERFKYAADKWAAAGEEGLLEYKRVWSRIAIIYQNEATVLADQGKYAEAAVVWFDCTDAWKKGGVEEVANLLQGVVSSYDSKSLLGAAEILLKKGARLSEQGRHNEASACFQNGARLAAMALKAKAEGAIRTRLGRLEGLLRMATDGALKVVGRFGGEKDMAFISKLASDAATGNRTAMQRLKEELAQKDVTYEEFKTALQYGQRHKLAAWGLDRIDGSVRRSLLERVGRFKTWGGRPIEAGRFMRNHR